MIPYIMDDTKTLAELVADTSNGLGRLTECTLADVKEVLNGEYVASVNVPIKAHNAELLHRGGIIKLKVNTDAPQLFRIARMKETLSTGMIELDLEHISYDLNKTVIAAVGVNTGRVFELLDMLNNQWVQIAPVYPGGVFTATSTIPSNDTAGGTWRRPITPRELLLGNDGLCAKRGWVMHWDNLTYSFEYSRGNDLRNSVILSYGKNILDYSEEADNASVYDGVVGYVFLQNKWPNAINSDLVPVVVGTTPQHIYMADVSEKAKNLTNAPTKAQVTTWARAWLANHPSINVPRFSIDVDMVNIYGTSQYENLKALGTVGLGDTITVHIKELNVNLDAVITEIVYDSLKESIKSVVLGNYRPSLAKTLVGMVNNNSSAITETRTQYSEVATNGSNGLMSATDKATLDSLNMRMLFDSYQAHPSTDWSTWRYNQYQISGNGFIIVMVNAYADTNASYGNLTAYVQHSTDGGTTWEFDGFTAYRHDQTSAISTDGIAVTVPIAVTDTELIRTVWRISKEDKKICRTKMLGVGVTATETVHGGAL